MRQARDPYSTRASFYGYFPTGVKWLLIVNTLVFLPYYWGTGTSLQRHMDTLFALYAEAAIRSLYVWQIFTYMFLHGGVGHLLLNMLALWMFGAQIERDWGTRRFLKYYFYCGLAAGLCVLTVNIALGQWTVYTIGASGAIFGVLAAFGVLYPNQSIYFWGLFPIKAKHLVMIFAAIEVVMLFGPGTGVSNVAHVGGMAFGYIYVKGHWPSWHIPDWRTAYKQWRLQRAKKKFQVYMRKHGRGPWVQ